MLSWNASNFQKFMKLLSTLCLHFLGLQSSSLSIHGLSHHPQQQQLPSPNYQQPTPWTISENSHCVHVFDKLRVQREQSRFADLILSVHGREFAAHRCVMAA